MTCFRLLALTALLLLLGCSETAESTIDDMADKSKELIQSARDISRDAAERMTEDIGAAREKASGKLRESFETLREQ
ncbi:hypothetical protein GCM10011533_16680 [Streptosporangium jomthongense]|uniref:Lipoprotein n=1 Tax=Marinobacter aromaticivorans TaxID=1494078 RepID=A0ABW2IUZ9_9GAMM|nr:hypothetical protein [Marinobacter aromaticivorans]GGE64964.1 hypothetical protein GCM10011533_16680 [Streptosporangium jomthongense]